MRIHIAYQYMNSGGRILRRFWGALFQLILFVISTQLIFFVMMTGQGMKIQVFMSLEKVKQNE